MANNTGEFAPASSPPLKKAQPALVPLAYSVKGAMAASGLGRSQIFELMAQGRLERVKVGKRTLIPRSSLEKLIFGTAA